MFAAKTENEIFKFAESMKISRNAFATFCFFPRVSNVIWKCIISLVVSRSLYFFRVLNLKGHLIFDSLISDRDLIKAQYELWYNYVT